jgi:hypothetical protein
LLITNLFYFATGGHGSLLAVHHHQFLHDILNSIVGMRFIKASIGAPRPNVKQKNEKALDKGYESI